MRKPKPKVHKHLAFDADIFEQAEEDAEAENKSLNEWMNDAAPDSVKDSQVYERIFLIHNGDGCRTCSTKQEVEEHENEWKIKS